MRLAVIRRRAYTNISDAILLDELFACYVDKEGNGCLEHTHQTGNDEVSAIPGRLHGVAPVRIEYILS